MSTVRPAPAAPHVDPTQALKLVRPAVELQSEVIAFPVCVMMVVDPLDRLMTTSPTNSSCQWLYSDWIKPVENKHPQRYVSTNQSIGSHETLLFHWFLGMAVASSFR
jgi:hypothetical protein